MLKPDRSDVKYYKRAANAFRIAEFAAVLALIVFFIACIGFWRETITVDNLRYLMKYVDLSGLDSTPSEASVSISASSDASYVMLGSDVGVVSDGRAASYHFSGSTLYDYAFPATTPCVVSNGADMLVYDISGKSLAVFGSVSRLCEMSFEYPVKSAYLSPTGCFAVVTGERTYRSGVVVYGNEYDKGNDNERFRFMSPDVYVMSCAVNASATRLACVTAGRKKGVYETAVMLYDTGKNGEDAKLASLSLDGALPLRMGYADNDGIVWVLTDSAFMLLDAADLKVLAAYSYHTDSASFFSACDDCFLLGEHSGTAGGQTVVRVYPYDTDDTEPWSASVPGSVIDAAYASDMLYVLTTDALHVFEKRGGQVETIVDHELMMRCRAVFADEYGRYILITPKGAERGTVSSLAGSDQR